MATLIQTLQHVLQDKDPLLANETKRILLKSALQALTLDFLYNHPIYRSLNFGKRWQENVHAPICNG